jgi:hypothetical protein
MGFEMLPIEFVGHFLIGEAALEGVSLQKEVMEAM